MRYPLRFPQDEVDQERRQVFDALDHAIEAFYGSNANDTAIAHISAKRAFSALQTARPPPYVGPLFDGLGFSDADAADPSDVKDGNDAPQRNGEGGSLTSGSVVGENAINSSLLSPSRLPGPSHPSDVFRPVEIWPPSPETRTISALTSFEPLCGETRVKDWVAHDSRKEKLRRQMVSREVSRLGVGGRRGCQPASSILM